MDKLTGAHVLVANLIAQVNWVRKPQKALYVRPDWGTQPD